MARAGKKGFGYGVKPRYWKYCLKKKVAQLGITDRKVPKGNKKLWGERRVLKGAVRKPPNFSPAS